MDRPVEWSPEAIEDVESIARFIARDSPRYARAVAERLLESAESCGIAPRAGRMVPELADPDHREHLVYSYRLIYRVDEGRILILAVVHGKRLLNSIATRFDEAE